MSYYSVFFIAVGLAMDAFAVSITNVISVKGFGAKHAVRQGIYFGLFQFMMPILGWFLGSSVKVYIEAVDHWIAFFLLAFIGGNMIRGTFSNEEEEGCPKGIEMTSKSLSMQAIATSIDALAVGISLAILDVNIIWASVVIGVVAFLLSFIGGILGQKLGGFLQKKAELAGGIVLVAIGLKILLEHILG